MGLTTFEYLTPADAENLNLTPERDNYLDAYDLTKIDIPELQAAAIEKYDNTITGFTRKFSSVEQLTSEQLRWTELEKRAITYDDAVLTVGTDNVLTRAGSAPVNYRLHEKVQLHTADGAGVFIVTEVVSEGSVKLGTYDTGSEDIIDGYTAALSAVYVYSLGIEVTKGSEGKDFTKGRKLPYRILSNIPAITRDVYTELGSTPPQLKWVKINGQARWFLSEIDATRENFLEAVEKKHIEGTRPSATSDAAAQGLQGTQGAFEAIRERGGNWSGLISDQADLRALIRHYNKVHGAGVNLFLCNQDQEFAFDDLGQSFNSSYGDTSVLSNYIGEYMNSQGGKVLNLDYKGFQHGGYTFIKQGWKYLKDETFRGNSAIADENRVNFLAIPIGMTPVADGDQDLAFNPRTTMRNYMTQWALRDYDSWTEGGAWVSPRTNGDDKFKVHFLNESLLALYNAEKFLLGEGVAQ